VLPSSLLPPVFNGSGVFLRIALPLMPYYVSKSVEQKTSLAQLFSSLVGLAGIIGIVGASLSSFERLLLRRTPSTSRPSGQRCFMCQCGCRRGSSATSGPVLHKYDEIGSADLNSDHIQFSLIRT